MARCALDGCGRWRPDTLVRRGRLGVSFGDHWFCSRACLEARTRQQLSAVDLQAPTHSSVPPLHLGTLLLHRQALSRELLHAALREQRETGLRLGEQLKEMGLVTSDDLVRALAAQAGVGYLSSIDPARVASGPGGLAPEAVRALGLVPFEVTPDRQRIRVASAAPLRRLAVAALTEMTGLRVEPFIVSDDDFQRLLKEYGSAGPAARDRGVRTVSDAAARIARAAEDGEAVRMQHTRCDSYVWVRLEGKEKHEDLVLSVDAPAEERTWLAEPTRP